MEFQPGWYDDGHGAQRWWDGTTWTEILKPAEEVPVLPPPGWYRDSTGTYRWWHGNAWADTLAPAAPKTIRDVPQSPDLMTQIQTRSKLSAPLPLGDSTADGVSALSPASVVRDRQVAALPEVNFSPSRPKLILLVCACSAFVVTAVVVLFSSTDLFEAFMAVVGILFFGWGCILTVRRLHGAKTVLLMTSQGLHPVSGGSIPWADVEAVGIGRSSGTKIIGVRLNSYDRYIASFTPAEVALIMRLALGGKIFNVVTAPFAGDPDKSMLLAGIPGQGAGVAGLLAWSRKHSDGYDLSFSPLLFDRRANKVVEAIRAYQATWEARNRLEVSPDPPNA